MSVPQVSVLMPVYNARPYVVQAAESVLAQTFPDFEFIIIDDGSTDGSTQILREFASRDRRIHLISRPNTGLVQALNEGLSYCRGEFVARMDADDISLPQRFAQQVQFLLSHPQHCLVGSRVELIDQDGDRLGLSKTPYLTHAEIDAAHLRGEFAVVHPSAMFRRSSVEQVGGYRDVRIGEDYDLWLKLGEIGQLANTSEPLLQYRWCHNSYSHERRSETQAIRMQILQDALARRHQQGDLPQLSTGHGSSAAEFSRRCAERALAHGYQRTARKHALQSLRLEPQSLAAWKLLVRCCVPDGLKHPVRHFFSTSTS